MNILFDNVITLLATGLIPMLRISAMVISAPLISLDVVSLPIRIVISIALTWLVYPHINIPAFDPMSAEGFTLIAREIFIGSIIAVVLQVVNAALIVAGQALSAGMGLGMAQVMDPSAGNVPVMSSFFIILSTLIFMTFGGHSLLFLLVIQSFEIVPIGVVFDIPLVIWNLMIWSSMIFLGAMLVAMPIMLTMMLINVCLGVITRSAPALNIFAVGFPAMIIAGLIMVFVMLTNIGHRIEWLWLEAFKQVAEIWQVT